MYALISPLFDFRCERALQSPSYEGAIEEFCREKGHGYIRPKNNATELIFAHVSECVFAESHALSTHVHFVSV